MKKLIIIFCLILLSVSEVEARPHGWPHHGFGRPPVHFVPRRHHHHGRDIAAGFAAGLIGGSLINYLTSEPYQSVTATRNIYTTPDVYTTTTVYNTPAVYTAPGIVSTQVSYPPCYTSTNLVSGAVSTNCGSAPLYQVPLTTQIITAN